MLGGVVRSLPRMLVPDVPAMQRISRMLSTQWMSVHGGQGSPYTRKVQSALRYKQIPFTSHTLMPGDMMGDWEERGFGEIKPKVSEEERFLKQFSLEILLGYSSSSI